MSLETFLNNHLAKYQYPKLLKTEVTNALKIYSDLRPIFDDHKKLISLEGTIPVLFMGSTYRIPIAIVLHTVHPYKAPIVYVRPTSSMRIKTSTYVDSTGLVHLPYIAEWKHPENDLIGLISVLQVVFGERSPVFLKDNVASAQGPKNSVQPSKPFPPPFPSTDLKIGSGWQYPYGMPVPHIPEYPPYLPQPSTIPGPTDNIPYPTSMPTILTPSATNTHTQLYDSGSVNEDQLKLSIQSAVIDQICRVKKELIYQHHDDLLAMRQTQTSLKSGGQKVQEMMRKMNDENVYVESSTNKLRNTIKELQLTYDNLLQSETNFNVDEAVDTTAPVYRQLVSSFAEEQAIEDAIYFLGEAMGKCVLDVEVYLKKVRELSRRQFMLRATVQKCREKAGLPLV